MSDRLSDEQVAWLADPDGRYPLAVLAREVQMRRKQDTEDARVLKRMADLLDAIDALHRVTGDGREGAWCSQCGRDGDDWPCPTHTILHSINK